MRTVGNFFSSSHVSITSRQCARGIFTDIVVVLIIQLACSSESSVTYEYRTPTKQLVTSTKIPTKTKSPESQRIRACIDTNSLRVRSGPGVQYSLVDGLTRDECIILIGRNEARDWVKFSKGWIAAEYLSYSGSLTKLPIVNYVSKPTLFPTQKAITQSQNPIRSNPKPTNTSVLSSASGGISNNSSSGGNSTGGASNCDPSYPTVCIPPYPPDLDCGQIQFRRFQVIGSDPHGFDGDYDGIGCESG